MRRSDGVLNEIAKTGQDEPRSVGIVLSHRQRVVLPSRAGCDKV